MMDSNSNVATLNVATLFENDLSCSSGYIDSKAQSYFSEKEFMDFKSLIEKKFNFSGEIAGLIKITATRHCNALFDFCWVEIALSKIIYNLLRYFSMDDLFFLERGLYAYKELSPDNNELFCMMIFFLNDEFDSIQKKYWDISGPIRTLEEAMLIELEELTFIKCRCPGKIKLDTRTLQDGWMLFVIPSKGMKFLDERGNCFMYGIEPFEPVYVLEGKRRRPRHTYETIRVDLLSFDDPNSEQKKELFGCYLKFVKHSSESELEMQHSAESRKRWIKKLAWYLGYSLDWLDKPMKSYKLVMFYGTLIQELVEFFLERRWKLLVSGYIKKYYKCAIDLPSSLNAMIMIKSYLYLPSQKNNVFVFLKDLSPLLRNTIGFLFKLFEKPFLIELAEDIKSFSCKNEKFNLEGALKNPKKSEYFKSYNFRNLCKKHELSLDFVCEQIKEAANSFN